MKIIPALHPRESPLGSGLMLVVTRAVCGENSLPVRRDDGMKKGPKIRARILGEQGAIRTLPINGERPLGFVMLDVQGGRPKEHPDSQERRAQVRESLLL